MRVQTASVDHICIACTNTIKAGEHYWGNSSQSFCKPCGDLKIQGLLQFNHKQKRYIDVRKMEITTCAYCNTPAEHITWSPRSNRPVCTEHIGRSIEQGDDGVATPSLESPKKPDPPEDPIETLDDDDDDEPLPEE